MATVNDVTLKFILTDDGFFMILFYIILILLNNLDYIIVRLSKKTSDSLSILMHTLLLANLSKYLVLSNR